MKFQILCSATIDNGSSGINELLSGEGLTQGVALENAEQQEGCIRYILYGLFVELKQQEVISALEKWERTNTSLILPPFHSPMRAKKDRHPTLPSF